MAKYQFTDLLGSQAGGLRKAADLYAGNAQANFNREQDALQKLLEAYQPEAYASAVRENAIEKANQAQKQLLGAASTKAGSAFNTAAQNAAQQATASAVSSINANAENQIADYNTTQLTNLLNQYSNQTDSYQNLLEQLLGQTQVTQKKKKNWGTALGSLAGGALGWAAGARLKGAEAGGPKGAAAGSQIGGQFGSLFDSD